MATLAPLGPPPVEAIYADPETAKKALQSHAAANSYSTAVASYKALRIVHNCSKGSKYQDQKPLNMHKDKWRKNTSTMKTNCPFWVNAVKVDVS
jgi:hypothetical protein